MLQEHRREGGSDDREQAEHAAGGDDDRIITRTEAMDRMEGIAEGGDEHRCPPAYRQALIEFLERYHADHEGLAEPRREELLREGCRVEAECCDVDWGRHLDESGPTR